MALKIFNIVLFWWWCVYCVVTLGIPSGVESRYLPTRRSSLSSDGEFERLQELLKNILEPDTYPLTSSLTAPRHLSDLDRTIRKKSDDIMMKYDPDYTSQQDDYDINAGIHDQQQQQQPFQHQQHSAQPPWRFILLNYSNRMPSKKPLKTIENASKYPQTQQTYYNKRIFSNGLNDINNNGHIQLNNHDDYDLFSDQFDLIPSTNFHNNFQYKMNQRTNGMN